MKTKSMYFCSNCKQYHHRTCNQNYKPTNSVNYLRFADLVTQKPLPHPNNFTLSSPKRWKDSKLVYADHDVDESKVLTTRPKSARDKEVINETHRYTSSYSVKKVKKSTMNENQYGENTTPSNHKNEDSTQRSFKIQLNFNKSTPHKNLPFINRQLEDQTKSQQQYQYSPHTIMMTERTESQSQSVKIHPRNENQFIKTSTIYESIQSSYRYGDQQRKILVGSGFYPQEMRYLTKDQVKQQRQKLFPNSTTMKINKNQKVLIDQDDSSKLKEIRSVFSSSVSQKNNEMDIRQKLEQLKLTLKQNVSKDKIIKKEKSSQILQTKDKFINQMVLKLENKKHEHLHKKMQSCKQLRSCSYFDNRCLGLNFKDQGEVSLSPSNNLF